MALSGSFEVESSWRSSDNKTRSYIFSWTATQDINNNTSTISWTVTAGGTYAPRVAMRQMHITIAGENVYSVVYDTSQDERFKAVGVTVASGTKTITHNTNGTASFTASIQSATYYTDINGSGSQEFTLNPIPRKSTLSAPTGQTLGIKQSLTVKQANSNFTHTITYTCGSASGTICTKSSNTNVPFTPAASLATQNTTGTAVTVKYKIETFNGSTSLGYNTLDVSYAIPTTVVPTISAFTVSDAMGYLSTYGGYVQGKSKFAVAITAAGASNSTIKGYKTTVNGQTYTTASFTTGAISSSGTLTLATTVTDSRGRTATKSVSATVLPYSSPQLTAFDVYRSDSNGTASSSGSYVTVKFSSSVASLNSKNPATYVVKYKKSNDTTYTSNTLTSYANNRAVSDGTYTFAADANSSYNVILELTDGFSTVSQIGTGKSKSKLWSFMAKGLGIALGKVADWAGFEIDMPAKFDQEVTFENSETYVYHDDWDEYLNIAYMLGDLDNGLSGKAPTSHASTTTTYGAATASSYGHVKLSDIYSSPVSNGAAANSLAASQNALYNAYNTLDIGKDGVTTDTKNNGRYFKFSNGTLICCHRITTGPIALTEQWGSMYQSPDANPISLGNWAYDFTERPYIFANVVPIIGSETGKDTNSCAFIEAVWNSSATSIGTTQLMRPASTVAHMYVINVVGIGRWK